MSSAIVECRPTAQTLRAIEAATAEWEAATRENGRTDEWDRRLIDSIIRDVARQGDPFSVNDIRDRFHGVKKSLVGGRLAAAQNAGLIRSDGTTPSTLKSTHRHHVRVYVPIPQGA